MKYPAIFIGLFLVLMVGVYFYNKNNSSQFIEQATKPIINNNEYINMKLESAVFEENGFIPPKYTCDGGNINPPLSISDVPQNAKSLTLILEDPDVPKTFRPDGVYDHWIVFNIPTTTRIISEKGTPPGVYGLNTGGTSEYIGPCPPNGEHRYIFSLYALDDTLALKKGATKKDILKAMEGHVVAETKLTGKYTRKK
jgi:Raf kinase inhibitor-like YbhB/YbcL family protein